jgi:Fe-S cluster biogenesis protein NfuA
MASLETGSQERIRRIEELVQKFEKAADPNTRADAQKLVQAIMDFHGAALERIMEILSEAEPAILDSFQRDELIASMLLLYGLHPVELETRVAGALDKVRPILRKHDSNVHLLGIEDGVVALRLEAGAAGCASTSATLKKVIEDAVYEAAADVMSIRIAGLIEEQPSANGLIQLTR